MAAPTKYKEEYCEQMIEFFSVEHTIEKKRTKINKDGSTYNWFEEVANSLPTFEGFAVRICNVCVDTLHEWKNKKDENGALVYPKFSEAYRKSKNYQKEMINDLGLRGFYNAAYTKFVAVNITDMRDVQQTEVTAKDGEPLFANYSVSPITQAAALKAKKEREKIDE